MLKSAVAEVHRGVERVTGLKEACVANPDARCSAKLSPFPGFL
jgi:hypothetical protein